MQIMENSVRLTFQANGGMIKNVLREFFTTGCEVFILKGKFVKKINLKQARYLTLSLLTIVALNSLTQAATPLQNASRVAAVTRSPRTGNEQLDPVQREAQAIELLRKFLTCPVAQVPKWQDFVDQMTSLLDGIPEYKELCKSLRSVRDVTRNIIGKNSIRAALTAHFESIKKIPQDIVDSFTKMGIQERLARIKF